jgi:selenophosphate synthase
MDDDEIDERIVRRTDDDNAADILRRRRVINVDSEDDNHVIETTVGTQVVKLEPVVMPIVAKKNQEGISPSNPLSSINYY